MRKTYIIGNWKMNTTAQSGHDLVANLTNQSISDEITVIVSPPFVYLQQIQNQLKSSPINVAAQNMYFEKNGAYTGEVSAEMLTDINCNYVILGHSERRHILNENNQDINQKLKAALDANITPILCIGETDDERKSGAVEAVLTEQLKEGLAGVEDPSHIIIAYEPVWAIGTGNVATPEIAQETHQITRSILTALYSAEIAAKLSILYGGSVNEKNIASLIGQDDIDGCLVGGASLKASAFEQIISLSTKEITT